MEWRWTVMDQEGMQTKRANFTSILKRSRAFKNQLALWQYDGFRIELIARAHKHRKGVCGVNKLLP